MDNQYDLLNYRQWNRRLMNLYWICNAIIFITQVILFIYLYFFKILWFPPGYHIFHLILLPMAFTLSFTALCEILVFLFEKNHRNLQPYVIALTCISFCTVLLAVHYTIGVLCVAYIIPIIFALIYGNKRVLSATFCGCITALMCVYFVRLKNPDLPYINVTLVDIITTIAIITTAYLICNLLLTRYRQVVDTLSETQRAAYESKMAREYAEALAETRSRFLANMSHEIRTPMNGIIGLTELVIDSGTFSDKEEDYLIKIRNSAVGLLDIVNDILDISKIDAGEMRLENKPFQLHGLLSECKTLIMHEAKQKGLRLYFYDNTNIDYDIVGDPTRLRQALINILSNAVKFTHKGNVTLLAKACEASSENRKISVYFEITDTGIGISEQHQKEIFDPFKQADDSITRSFGGTGLGLSITQNIIKAMGGEIIINSVPNIGSRFSFSLEFKIADEINTMEVDVISVERPVFSGDVLLCEDNAMGRQVAVENLKRIGLTVFIAENGKAALDLVSERERENKPFDVILMDIHMPVMDGLQTTKKLIEMNIKTPVIAMTANVMADDREMYLNAGMRECLYKPFRARELWECLLKYMVPTGAASEIKTNLNASHDTPVDIVLGLENNAGSEELYHKSLALFIKEMPETLAALENAAAKPDFPLVRSLAHTARNNANIIGAVTLAELASIIEESARHDGSYFKIEMLDGLKRELAKVIDYIDTKISQHAAQNPT